MNEQQKHSVRQYINEMSTEVKTAPLVSEYTPALAGILICLFAGFPFGAVGILCALVLRYIHQNALRHSSSGTGKIQVVTIGDPGRKHGLFSGMLNRSYAVYMPSLAYKLAGVIFIITGIMAFSISWLPWFLALPVCVWMVNWGRSYLSIGNQAQYIRPEEDIQDAIWHESSQPLPETPGSRQQTPEPEPVSRKQAPKSAPDDIPIPNEANRYFSYIEKQLKQCCEEMDEKCTNVDELLEMVFGGSEMSKRRYIDQIEYARVYVYKNLESSRRVIKLCGKSAPSDSRRQILETYVQDSKDVVQRVNMIIDELIRVDQNASLKSGDLLDESLNELAQTTQYYSRA